MPPAVPVQSLPSRGRGLKSLEVLAPDPYDIVAPFAGAWIEIETAVEMQSHMQGRSLRGGVD